jgi:hypothetical protein
MKSTASTTKLIDRCWNMVKINTKNRAADVIAHSNKKIKQEGSHSIIFFFFTHFAAPSAVLFGGGRITGSPPAPAAPLDMLYYVL